MIDDILDKLVDTRIFTTINLKNGFFHVPIAKDSQKYVLIVTYSGQYRFLKMPFGICNASAVFQRCVNSVFHELIKKGIAFSYIDDIVIPACDYDESLERF